MLLKLPKLGANFTTHRKVWPLVTNSFHTRCVSEEQHWLHEGTRRVLFLFKKLALQVNHGAQIKVCCLRETFRQAAAGRLFSACVAESTERGLAGWCIVCCLLRGNKRARDSLDGLCTVEIDEAAAAAGGIAHAAAAAAAVLMYKREREGGDTKASAGLVGWSNMCPA